MSTEILIILIVVGVILFFGVIIGLKSYITKKREKSEEISSKSFVDITDKFMLRKEYKVLKLIQKVIPEGYLAFPKILVKSLIDPVGDRTLYQKIKYHTVDVVIIEENTLKPVMAIDIYDNNPGDYSLDEFAPLVVKAFEMAKLPLVGIKVKPDYDIEDIKKPIYKILMPSKEVEEDILKTF